MVNLKFSKKKNHKNWKNFKNPQHDIVRTIGRKFPGKFQNFWLSFVGGVVFSNFHSHWVHYENKKKCWNFNFQKFPKKQTNKKKTKTSDLWGSLGWKFRRSLKTFSYVICRSSTLTFLSPMLWKQKNIFISKKPRGFDALLDPLPDEANIALWILAM